MTIDTVPPPAMKSFYRNIGMGAYVADMMNEYPNFSKFKREGIIDIIREVYPFEVYLNGLSHPIPHYELTPKMMRLFKTYMFIMKEYHELWDL